MCKISYLFFFSPFFDGINNSSIELHKKERFPKKMLGKRFRTKLEILFVYNLWFDVNLKPLYFLMKQFVFINLFIKG